MDYKVIKAKTYTEAMSEMKKLYGDNALAINHKKVRVGGLMNSRFLAKEMVELTVGIPESRAARITSSRGGKIDYTVGEKKENLSQLLKNAEDLKKEVKSGASSAGDSIKNVLESISRMNGMAEKTAPEKKTVQTKQETASGLERQSSDRLAGLEKSIEELKAAFEGFASSGKSSVRESASEESEVLEKYAGILRDNDFEEKERADILKEIRNTVSPDDLKDEVKIEKSLRELLKSRITVSGPINPGNRKKIIMFMGPTGVGKTTTLAKMGALYALRDNKKVLFITLDNYRIAATEQLKKYAEIIRIPVLAINDQKEFREAVENGKADVILVDTAGRSYRNQMKIAEIKAFADQVSYDLEKVLCVSANTRKNDVIEVFRAFDAVNFNSVIITKVDEASNVGNIVSAADKYNKPVSYFTNGQEVPNDIAVADSDRLVNLMMGENSI